MKIYLDEDFKCRVAGGGRTVETAFFEGKCDAFIEGYRFVPGGERWTRSDGVVFEGEMFAPWQDFEALDAAQRAYEQEKIAEYEALINALYEEVRG